MLCDEDNRWCIRGMDVSPCSNKFFSNRGLAYDWTVFGYFNNILLKRVSLFLYKGGFFFICKHRRVWEKYIGLIKHISSFLSNWSSLMVWSFVAKKIHSHFII